jgi:hypothetical protein
MENATPTNEGGVLGGVVAARDTAEYIAPASSRKGRSSTALVVQVEAEPIPITIGLNGRLAWAFDELLEAGAVGCTPIFNPAPRWSHYVHRLRKAGLDIETIDVPHGGPYPGFHGRYVLRSVCRVIRRYVSGSI